MWCFISAYPLVRPNLRNIRTCDHLWNSSEIQFAIVQSSDRFQGMVHYSPKQKMATPGFFLPQALGIGIGKYVARSAIGTSLGACEGTEEQGQSSYQSVLLAG